MIGLKLACSAIAGLYFTSNASARMLVIHDNGLDPVTIPYIDPHRENIDFVTDTIYGEVHYEVDKYGLDMPSLAPWASYDFASYYVSGHIGGSYTWFAGIASALAGVLENTEGAPGTFVHYAWDLPLDTWAWGYAAPDQPGGVDAFYYGPVSTFDVRTSIGGYGSSSAGGVFGTPEFQQEIYIETHSVPEPASWVMMLGGFAFIGGAMRYRRKAAVSFA